VNKLLSLMLVVACLSRGWGATRSSVTQYGITWTFDKAYEAGQFVTGDWWVVGPVQVVGIAPAPGPAPAEAAVEIRRDQWGNTSLSNDNRMRNGSPRRDAARRAPGRVIPRRSVSHLTSRVTTRAGGRAMRRG
jgi:hypothetical protein